nr:hypothetical protein [uncultured Kingella sp.]
MKKSILNIMFAASLAVGLSACGSMTTQQRNTAAGVAIGGAAGSLIGGDTGSTLGGAALGGVIGSQVHKWHR